MCADNGVCGVSAYPMAGRTAHITGRKEDPENFIELKKVSPQFGVEEANPKNQQKAKIRKIYLKQTKVILNSLTAFYWFKWTGKL